MAGPADGRRRSSTESTDKLGLVVETRDIACWGAFAEALTSSEVRLLLPQETHADVNKDKELIAFAGKLGWEVGISPTAPKREGNSGGVSISSRRWLGFSHVCQELKGEIVPRRAVLAKWQAPGQPAFPRPAVPHHGGRPVQGEPRHLRKS